MSKKQSQATLTRSVTQSKMAQDTVPSTVIVTNVPVAHSEDVPGGGDEEAPSQEQKAPAPEEDLYEGVDADQIAAFFNEFRDDSAKKKVAKKVIRRVSGGENLNIIRFGPEFVDDDWYECTPLPLWLRPDPIIDFESLLYKTAQEVLDWSPLVPQTFSAYWEWTQNREGALSFDPAMSDMEEEDMMFNYAELYPSKILAFILPPDKKKKDWYKQVVECSVDGRKCLTKDVIMVELEESSTYLDLELKGKIVLESDEQVNNVKASNERYLKMIKHHRETDICADDCSQTYQLYSKDNFSSYKIRGCGEFGIDTHWYYIDDEYEAIAKAEKEKLARQEEEEMLKSMVERAQRELAAIRSWHGSSSSSHSSDEDEQRLVSTINWEKYKDSGDESSDDSDSDVDIDSDEDLFDMMSDEDEFDTELPLDVIYGRKAELAKHAAPQDKDYPNISHSVCVMERMICMRHNQARQADMRGYLNYGKLLENFVEFKRPKRYVRPVRPEDRTDDNTGGPQLTRFWAFKYERCKGKEVTNITIHPLNGEIFAASFGSSSYADESYGMVLVWNAKNIYHPERVYELKSPCTAIAFGELCPYLLAVGMLDGNIAMFDIRTDDVNPVISTIYQEEKHRGPVWQLHWLIETQTTFVEIVNETLLSVGDDGYLYRWSLLKGFESTPLLKFRRSHMKPPGRRENRAEALLSSLSVGYVVAFFPNEPEVFLLGTEEGFIHKCTTAHNEQYVGTYMGHSGPVYAISFSKFDKDCFCSCGGDHTMKVWKTDYFLPLINMQTGLRSIFDCSTVPTMSAVFICVTEFYIEVWDLTLNTLEPVVKFKPAYAVGLRKCVYSDHLNCVIVGDDSGACTVFGLRDFPKQPTDFDDQHSQLLEGLFPGYKRRIRESERMAEEVEESERLRREQEEREKEGDSKAGGSNRGAAPQANQHHKGIDKYSTTAQILAATARTTNSKSSGLGKDRTR